MQFKEEDEEASFFRKVRKALFLMLTNMVNYLLIYNLLKVYKELDLSPATTG